MGAGSGARPCMCGAGDEAVDSVDGHDLGAAVDHESPSARRWRPGHDDPMRMPTPPNQRASTVLSAIHSLFFATGDWPSFADVDHYLVPRGEVDSEDVVATMPAGLLYGVTPGQPRT